jgi:hypothetical protein
MRDLVPVFIIGFIVLGIYKIFELLVRRKERLMFIEKFGANCSDKEILDSVHLPAVSFGKDTYRSFWSLRIALLMIGIGIGCLMNFFTVYVCSDGAARKMEYSTQSLILFSYISVFGGISLLISYLIEAKCNRKNQESKESSKN